MHSEKSETPDVIHFLKENPLEMFKDEYPWSGCTGRISSVTTKDSNAPSLFARRWTVGCCVIVLVIPVLHIKSPSISSIYLQFQALFCDTIKPQRGRYLDSEWKILWLLKASGFTVSERVRTLQKRKSDAQSPSELGGDRITNDYNTIKFWKASTTHIRLQLFSEVKHAQTNSSLYHGGRELSNAPKHVR